MCSIEHTTQIKTLVSYMKSALVLLPFWWPIYQRASIYKDLSCTLGMLPFLFSNAYLKGCWRTVPVSVKTIMLHNKTLTWTEHTLCLLHWGLSSVHMQFPLHFHPLCITIYFIRDTSDIGWIEVLQTTLQSTSFAVYIKTVSSTIYSWAKEHFQ